MPAPAPPLPLPPPRRWTIDAAHGLVLSTPASLMGVLNATPDSFSDGGLHRDPAAAVRAATAMREAGAAWIDLGGESTRPGAAPVDAAEELARVLPVLEAVRAVGLPISVDTAKAAVARACLARGARLVNDVSAGADPGMFAAVAEAGAAIVLMHMRGTPRTMQQDPRYEDVVDEVERHLLARMAAAVRAGVAEDAIVLDPGIGFGKTPAHNLAVLRALPRLAAAGGRPLLVGISRKSFLAAVAGGPADAARRDALSHVAHALLAPWCALLRVHDVAGAAQALRLAAAFAGEGG